MKFEELLEAIDYFDSYLNEKFPISGLREKMFARTVKLNEEVGELCAEVLAFDGDQRDEKLQNSNQETLEGEFADVIITTLLLAKTMDVDVRKSLKNKIAKIKDRFREK